MKGTNIHRFHVFYYYTCLSRGVDCASERAFVVFNTQKLESISDYLM